MPLPIAPTARRTAPPARTTPHAVAAAQIGMEGGEGVFRAALYA